MSDSLADRLAEVGKNSPEWVDTLTLDERATVNEAVEALREAEEREKIARDSLADRLAERANEIREVDFQTTLPGDADLLDEAVEVLREKDAEIRRLRKAIWPSGQIGRHR